MKINLQNFKKINSILHKSRGFTLVETLVSVTLFSFVTYVAITALFSFQEFNNKLKVTKSIYDNVYLSMDIISLDIKQGANFENKYSDLSQQSPTTSLCSSGPGGNSAPSTSCLIFDYLDLNTDTSSPTDTGRVGFFLENGKIKKYSNDIVSQSITSDDVEITKLKFELMGGETYENGDTQQPMIKILLKGKSKTLPSSTFSIESVISQRSAGN